MPTVTPFLMFEGQAQQAMDLYTRVLPDSEVLDDERYRPDSPGERDHSAPLCP